MYNYSTAYNYTIELRDAKRIFRLRLQDYYTHLTKALSFFPREIHRCDVDPSQVGKYGTNIFVFERTLFYFNFALIK